MNTQMQTCTRGSDCKHPDGPELPISEFYDYRSNGGRLFKRCVACIGKDQSEKYYIEKCNQYGSRLDRLKAQRPGRRGRILFNWISDGVITRQEFDVIFRDLTKVVD